ncbi:MAG: hypothetical protein V4568_18160 [Pseudomonadota bacterium]
MQAITVKGVEPTDTKGIRYIARCKSGRIIFNKDHGFTAQENFRLAAEALIKKLGWDYDLMEGIAYNDDSVFILIEKKGG